MLNQHRKPPVNRGWMIETMLSFVSLLHGLFRHVVLDCFEN